MHLIKNKQRVAITGIGLFTASLCALPFTATASAAASPAGSVGDNEAVNVQTEYDCNSNEAAAYHALTYIQPLHQFEIF